MVLLAPGAADGRDELPGDAEIGEGPERGTLAGLEVADRLEQADHALLNDVVAVGPGQEVGTGLHASEVPVPGEQRFGSPGVAVAVPLEELLVGGDVVARLLDDGGEDGVPGDVLETLGQTTDGNGVRVGLACSRGVGCLPPLAHFGSSRSSRPFVPGPARAQPRERPESCAGAQENLDISART